VEYRNSHSNIERTAKIIIAPTETVLFHARAAKKTTLITAIIPVNIAANLYCGIKCQAFEREHKKVGCISI